MLEEVLKEKKRNQLSIEYTNATRSKDVFKEIKSSLVCFDIKSSLQFKANSYVWLDRTEELIQKDTNISRRFLYNIRRIKKNYVVDNENKLTQFIVKNPEVITLLLEAQKQIRKYFPQERLTLSVSLEYEHTEWERLEISIFIENSENFDEAFDRLSQFDHGWWLDNSSGIGLKLYIGLEFE
jgi:hypothetical protein